jgi:two-component system response regulator GlrR
MSDPRESGLIKRRARVLVADDDEGARYLLRVVLESAGYDVAEVHDGSELYDVLAMSPRGHFSLVIADHLMPRMLGLEVLSRMSARTRFILLTGNVAPTVESAAERMGAVAFIRKPASMLELLRIVRAALAADTPPGMLRASGA